MVVSWAMPKTTSPLLTTFLSEYANQQEAANALGISVAYVSRLKSGLRRINPRIAQKIEEVSGGRYCRAALLWGDMENKH